MRFRAVLACLAAALVAAPSTGMAAPRMEVALQDDSLLLSHNPYPLTRSLPQLTALEVSWVRTNVVWTHVLAADQVVKPERPARLDYRWGPYDELVDNAAAHGIQVEMTLTGPAPAWATEKHRVGVYGPDPAEFKAFARAAAEHFEGRVSRYSIWNEPNHSAWLAPPSRAASIYRSLYVAGYRAVKHVAKDNQVLIGETAPYRVRGRSQAPLAFIRRVTCVDSHWRRHGCGLLRADGFAHHPYDFRHPPGYRYPGADNVTLATLGRLTTALRKLAKARALLARGGTVPPVYLTEYGYFSSGERRLSPSRHAAYLTRAFGMAQRRPEVRQLLQYLLVTPPRKYRFFDTSLIRRDGRPTRPYEALRAWAERAASDGRITTPRIP